MAPGSAPGSAPASRHIRRQGRARTSGAIGATWNESCIAGFGQYPDAKRATPLPALWNVLWILLSAQVPSPFGGTFGLIGFVAVHLGWLSAAAFGGAVLLVPATWAGMDRWQRAMTRLAGFALLIGSVATNLGDDRLGLVTSVPYGELWSTIALTGLFLNGAGWVLLGGILLFAGRVRRAA